MTRPCFALDELLLIVLAAIGQKTDVI